MVSENFYRNCFFLTTLFVILVCLIVAFLNFDEAKFTGQFECGRIQSVTPVYIQTKHNGTKAKKNILIAFGDEKLLSRVVSSNKKVSVGQEVKILEKKTKITNRNVYVVSYNHCNY